MKTFEKSESIKAGIRKSFQTGNSKLARRKCYGYNIAHPTLGQGPGAGSRRRKTGPHLPRSAGRGILNKYRKFLWPNGNIL